MADDEDQESKTESPSEKKMRDAAEHGNLPISREAPLFATTLAFYIYFVFFMPQGVSTLYQTLRDLMEKPDQWIIGTGTDVISLFVHLGWSMAAMLGPALLLFMLFGLTQSFAQHLPSFVLDRITPKMERLSLIGGIGRMFSVMGFVEFGKSLFKIIVVAIIMFVSMRGQYFGTLDAMLSDPQIIFVKLSDIVQEMLVIVLFATGLLTVMDLGWQRYNWYQKLRMTRQEVKDEHKQSQGDPVVKARQRSAQRDQARRRMMNNVPRATMIITNPTHFAVALRYVRTEMEAPIVLAKGQDLIALKIREIAEENNIPIFEDPPLARSMFAQVSVDSVIPPIFYKAVAEIVQRLYAADSKNKRRLR
ncbi:flagellar biosynthesis protein FlhB [Agrobacterium vitis]|uniref:flagellar biosynthesis protein FlhB n=1 Tax=Agrobacterium vitis TaxID=373 RepID=UPI001572458F|nr:flagellar biosynthesis protein FlhB [Agrobacterium vitis]NSZ15690.1 flagellar biosynthesis protein FlhB [Agrobacterium vitis]UJL86647.1 flagellar biosynthesis protein FlhB [Agrobacterium vitis]BCH60714.1 flagellar biosynthesis protein FlhB [Agrobacterium vitis]